MRICYNPLVDIFYLQLRGRYKKENDAKNRPRIRLLGMAGMLKVLGRHTVN